MLDQLKKLFQGNKSTVVGAPLTGELVTLKEVPDPTFSEEILGPGVAILPSEGKITAPCSGTVSVMFETGHAISITTEEGAELLIHVGIDTVNLQGKYYTPKCKAGDTVHPGDVLLEFDPEGIRSAGYEMITPIILCNPEEFRIEGTRAPGSIKAGEKLFELVKVK